MSDFLFHKVSEKEKESIKEEAKKIMEDFSYKLSKLGNEISESLIERKDVDRGENKSKSCTEESFRELMFKNAPNKEDGFIISEKKKW